MTTSTPRGLKRSDPVADRGRAGRQQDDRQQDGRQQDDRQQDSRQHGEGPPAAVVAVKRLFAAETGNFFVLLGTTLFLSVFGLVMVLSSSAVTSFNDSDDFFAGFLRQGMFALIGLPAMLIASRMPAVFWRRWSTVALVLGVGLQVLVVATPLGIDINGNRNWLALGSVSIQPSEITKVALVIWLASVLSSRIDRLDDLRSVALPVVPVAGIAIGLVLAGKDLGTAMIMIAIVLGALFFAGVKLRYLAIPVALIAIVTPMVALSSNSRSDRIAVWLDGCAATSDYAGPCWQTVHGWWALAAGGIFGVGLGNSKAKWSWLPEADNDFIFAIIGEELGLIGAIVVLALFVVLAVVFVRIMREANDPFARIAVSAVMMWIVSQAFVNIAVVLGVLPVLGVPLPLMSAGGTALITSLFAIGIVLSFAREAQEPMVVEDPTPPQKRARKPRATAATAKQTKSVAPKRSSRAAPRVAPDNTRGTASPVPGNPAAPGSARSPRSQGRSAGRSAVPPPLTPREELAAKQAERKAAAALSAQRAASRSTRSRADSTRATSTPRSRG